MENLLVHSFQKNESEEIRISLREYKSRHYLDLRLFFQPQNQREMVPSKKGITVSIEFLPELKRGLLKFEQEIRQVLSNPEQEGAGSGGSK